MAKKSETFNPSRRKFIKGAALTVGTTGLAGAGQELNGAPQTRIRWDGTRKLVVVGAGASVLPVATMPRVGAATVILTAANHDMGGQASLRAEESHSVAARVCKKNGA